MRFLAGLWGSFACGALMLGAHDLRVGSRDPE